MSNRESPQLNESFQTASSEFPNLDNWGQANFLRKTNEYPSLDILDSIQLRDLIVEAVDNGRSYMVQKCALDLAFNLEEKGIIPEDEEVINLIFSTGIYGDEEHQDKTIKLAKRLIEDGALNDIDVIKKVIIDACGSRNNTDYIKYSAIDLIPPSITSGVLLGNSNSYDNDMEFLNETLGRVEYAMAGSESLSSYSDGGKFAIEQHMKTHGFKELPKHSKFDIASAVMDIPDIDESLVDSLIDKLCPVAKEGRYDSLGDALRSRWNGIKNLSDTHETFELTL